MHAGLSNSPQVSPLFPHPDQDWPNQASLTQEQIAGAPSASALFGVPVIAAPEAPPAAGAPAATDTEAPHLRALLMGISQLAHDVRHSLALIHGSSQLLLDPGAADPHYYAGVINEESGYLSRLIQEILDLARLEMGRFELQRVWMDLGALVRTTANAASVLSETHTIQVNIPADPPLIYADPTRIRQVLLNLLTNAIKHCPDNTPILVSVAVSDGPGQRVYVSVYNEGAGIPAELEAQIFEPFWTDALTGPGGVSLGLGLPICRGIVEAHGGRIWLDRQIDRGTLFTFFLPCATLVPGA